jgi:anti-sigma B factor antagonist
MDFKTELQGDKIIVYLDGEIDLDKTDDVRKSIMDSLEKSNKIFANLNAVKYIDSSGVSVLIEAQQKANEMEKEFYLQKPSDAVMSVLKMAKLDVFFLISN